MRLLTVVISICGLMLTLSFRGSAMTTNCEQTLKLLGLNWRASKVLWIAEDLSGECQSSRILQVILSDSGGTAIASYLKNLNDWNWLKEGLQTEKPIAFQSVSEQWMSKKPPITLTAPPADSTLLSSFQQHINAGGSNGRTWNKSFGAKEIKLPKIEGIESTLIYHDPRGLYVNYEIGDAYYFAEARILLVFTYQNVKAVGLDTMHGFLIFTIDQ